MSEAFNPQASIAIFWVDTIADKTVPTAAEINVGIRLSRGVLADGVAGFSSEHSTVDATSIEARREQNVPGLSTVTAGGLTMKRGTAGSDNADLFDELNGTVLDSEGYVVFVLDCAPSEVPAAGMLADVHPSRLASVNAMPLTGAQSARYMVGFTHPTESALNVAVV